jgi:hypothetical protein
MRLSTIQSIHDGLCTLMQHCTGANEHVVCSACSPFIKELFHALCKVYEVCTVKEQIFMLLGVFPHL